MKKLVEDLVSLGLSNLEAKVYINLLKKSSLTATEISRLAKINRTQTYDILPKLIQRGICIETRGSVKKYFAVEPEKVLSSLEKELNEKRDLIKNLNNSLQELYNDNLNKKNPLDFLQVLSSRNSIISRIETLESSAKEIVLAFNKPPYAMNIGSSNISQVSKEIRKPEKESIDRGVTFLSLYEIEPDDIPAFIQKMQYFENTGEHVRISTYLPFKMFIFDNQILMLALKNEADESLSFTTMIFEHSDFAQAMSGIFDIYWKKALTIEEFKIKEKI
jgi:sugar-specific transcriptional regulator TrmB